MGNMKNLIIVESPAKAKTIERILGKNYKVVASFGHVRDLPKTKLGVDVEHDYQPKYVVPAKARKTITNLKNEIKKADKIYLATDLDREGEAIAWHIVEAVKLPKKKEVTRVVFPSITKQDVEAGMKASREIDFNLVDAQQARRVLDRLVGYKLSPLLWKKIFKGLSAGRVQSVALRLVVERERERENFKPEEYWTAEADFYRDDPVEKVRAKLVEINQQEYAPDNEKDAKQLSPAIEQAIYQIAEIEKKEKKRQPYSPFITSSLQQEAYNKLKFSAKKTMTLAQKLYEGQTINGKQTGLITYMRTDSRNISDEALEAIRTLIKDKFGDEYLPEKPVLYKKKSKSAQEAHEAIRVTYPKLDPDSIKSDLDKDLFKLYELIWKRTIACQMNPARFNNTVLTIKGEYKKDIFVFKANGINMIYDGWLKVWDYPKAVGEDVILPEWQEADQLQIDDLLMEQHFTKPPARFTEATLVKALEKNGVGRPSTYASIMTTIQARGYVSKEEGRFKPEEVGYIVNDFLVKHFANIVDINFTADMENKLDKIATGEIEWVPMLDDFYQPFIKQIAKKEKSIKKEEVVEEKEVDEKCPECGKALKEKFSRYGKFLACTGFPDCKFTKPLGDEEDDELVKKAEPCEKCGGKMVMKKSRYGSFLACSNYPDCKNIRNIVKDIDIDCPQCKEGKLVQKRSKRGKVFYGCSRYPDCKTAFWNEPTKDKCEDCGSLLTKAKSGKIKCEQCAKQAREKK